MVLRKNAGCLGALGAFIAYLFTTDSVGTMWGVDIGAQTQSIAGVSVAVPLLVLLATGGYVVFVQADRRFSSVGLDELVEQAGDMIGVSPKQLPFTAPLVFGTVYSFDVLTFGGAFSASGATTFTAIPAVVCVVAGIAFAYSAEAPPTSFAK